MVWQGVQQLGLRVVRALSQPPPPSGSERLTSSGIVPVLLAVAVGAVGVADAAVAPEVTLAPLYVPIVVVAAWRGGFAVSAVCAVLCAATGALGDSLHRAPLWGFGARTGTSLWNAGSHLFVFLVVGGSVAKLHALMRERDSTVQELRRALDEVRTLQGLLPICAWCKRIRDEERDGTWCEVEQYVAQRTRAQFTHGICPSCAGALRAEGMARAAR